MGLYFCGEINFISLNMSRNISCPVFTNTYQHTKFQVIGELYLISVLCIIGLFGNIMAIIVLRNDKLRREALFLLQALAIVDGLYIFVAIWRHPLEYLIPDKNLWNTMQLVVFPLLKILQTITIWMMVLVTTDRYIYVCWPLHAQRFFTHRNRRMMAIVVVCSGVLYNLPRFFENCIVKYHDPCTNITTSNMIYRHAFNKPLYFDIYQYGLYLILLYICPLLILCFMNCRLIQAIQHSRRYPRGGYQQEQDYKDSNATLVLVIIVVAFIVCQTPELISKIITLVIRYNKARGVHVDEEIDKFREEIWSVISEVMMVLNSSINFFIYVAFGRRFRYIMKETFKYLAYSNSTMVTRETVPLQANIINFIR